MTHARSSRDLTHFKGDSRKSIAPKYTFSVDKDDLNENIDDIMKNFESFSQFAQQGADDSEDSNEVFDGNTTPTNPETPKNNVSFEFCKPRYVLQMD